jgi:protein phosphatase
MSSTDFRALLDGYLSALSDDANLYANRTLSLVLPTPNPDLLRFLFRQVQTLFQSDPVLLDIPTPCIIIGDIHGQVLDLLRILITFGQPCPLHYLFLGDLVDRGEFSIETLVIPFLLKSLYPEHVFVIRGNHEFTQLSSTSGFLSEITAVFGNSKLYDEAVRAFREIPLAARVDGSILCVHGGIGPGIFSLEDIRSIQRPIDDFNDPVVESLVWSDPSSQISTFERSSARGAGFLFGEDGLTPFLEQSKLTVLVRAHECVSEGYAANHGGKCLTVFSASNYCMSGNRGAVLEVVNGACCRPRHFNALSALSRKEVVFKSCGRASVFRPRAALVMCPRLESAQVQKRQIPSASSTKRLPALMPGNSADDSAMETAGNVGRGAQVQTPVRKPRRLSGVRLAFDEIK